MQISNMFWVLLFFLSFVACKSAEDPQIKNQPTLKVDPTPTENGEILPGAESHQLYLPLLKGKKVGLVVNQTSVVGRTHLADFLLDKKVNVLRAFAPEHGFRGKADAGEKINNELDPKTGLKVISLYGKNKKPSSENLTDLDVIVFDIQDVGVRFYTFISTLHYVMEACAENGVSLIVLDRPNPNGHYVDGPILKKEWSSFVGMHPVPIVYGMTIGEYAQMINGEGWLNKKVKADLTVVECKNYTHDSRVNLTIRPSPNLPNRRSILLYPSLCLFEGTSFSIGRGTQTPFQVLGHPQWISNNYSFIPRSLPGARNPKHMNRKCGGHHFDFDIEILEKRKSFNLTYLRQAFLSAQETGFKFFSSTDFFDKLAGSDELRLHLEKGSDLDVIIDSWKEDLEVFKGIRKKYLLYP